MPETPDYMPNPSEVHSWKGSRLEEAVVPVDDDVEPDRREGV